MTFCSLLPNPIHSQSSIYRVFKIYSECVPFSRSVFSPLKRTPCMLSLMGSMLPFSWILSSLNTVSSADEDLLTGKLRSVPSQCIYFIIFQWNPTYNTSHEINLKLNVNSKYKTIHLNTLASSSQGMADYFLPADIYSLWSFAWPNHLLCKT